MKKTAKELVYDAINYLRKPTADVTLSPIQDSDNLFDTYGFSRKDVCKLCEMIGLDAEMDIDHAPVHEIRTVGEVVEVIGELIKSSKESNDVLFALGALSTIGNINEQFTRFLSTIATLEAYIILTGGNKESLNGLPKILKELTKVLNSSDLGDPELSAMKTTNIKMVDFKREIKKAFNSYVK